MKAVLIVLDQAHYDQIIADLSSLNIRGFTSWNEVYGRGSKDGLPHYGTHGWPSLNSAILTIIEDDRVPILLKYLKELDTKSPQLGLRSFVWNIEEAV